MKRITAVSLAIFVCALLSGCGAKQYEEAAVRTVYAMDTVMSFSVYGDESLLDGCEAIVGRLEKQLSVTDEGSEIYALNQNGENELTDETAHLVERSLDMCAKTQGCLDISILPVLRAWGFTGTEYSVPSANQLETLKPLVDYRNVSLSGNNARLLENGMSIDLGSVAKGYTGDMIIQYLRDNKVSSALINLGGNVQTLGTKPDGSKWRVAIASPYGSGYIGCILAENQAVITSGNYQRYFEMDGVRYHHIIDPFTLRPAKSGLVSVTVVGESGFECDALSTALFVMGKDAAVSYYRQHGGFEFVLIDSEGTVYISGGLESLYTPLDGRAPVVLS